MEQLDILTERSLAFRVDSPTGRRLRPVELPKKPTDLGQTSLDFEVMRFCLTLLFACAWPFFTHWLIPGAMLYRILWGSLIGGFLFYEVPSGGAWRSLRLFALGLTGRLRDRA
ncbi:MAG: hypothetical protein FD126_1258 [Elusimicrobia bacterium]|nr:MAG: hypothetical protein FD126_1258 [Elusimicrobiota bacterium]